jgi:type I restriction enzyme S subunit
MGNEHWVEIPFKDVITTLESGSRPKGGVKGILEGIPSIGAEHLDSDGGFNFSNIRYIPESFARNMKRGVINQGDILIVKDGATTGKVSLVTKDFPFKLCCINEHVFICRLDKNISNEYSFYFLRSQTGQEQIMAGFHGGAQGGINSSFVDNIYFPLPPFNEQKRIVEKLDAVLPKIRQSRERLEKIPIILKKFKMSVLTTAFSEKTRFERLEDVAELRLGKMLDQHKNKGNFQPYLRNLNVRWFGFDLNDLFKMKFSSDEEDRYNVVKGDLVVCEGGEPGRCAVWRSDNPIKYQKALHRIRSKKGLSVEYVMYYIHFLAQTGELEQCFTGTGIKHLTGASLKALLVPFPPFPKQQKIAHRVEQLFYLADSLEEKYQSAISRVNKIEQTVLAKAFRGELAEADPNDEPAGELLERIR